MGSSLALGSALHSSSGAGWGTAAALGSRVRRHRANARLAMAALPKRDCCECNTAWGEPEMKDRGRVRERGHTKMCWRQMSRLGLHLQPHITPLHRDDLSSNPTARTPPPGHVHLPHMQECDGVSLFMERWECGWVGLHRPFAMGYSSAALQRPFLRLGWLSSPVVCSPL